jgi:hypothetical protein
VGMLLSSCVASPLLRALRHARADLPNEFERFDTLIQTELSPSFTEYSARIAEGLSAWRETLYFDLRGDPSQAAAANQRWLVCADALGFAVPAAFRALLGTAATLGPEVLQVVLGYDAADEPAQARLKYYLIFREDPDRLVEGIRVAVAAPALPKTLQPGSVYILGLDFARAGLHDFKLYVRLDPSRIGAVIRNLGEFAALWRGSRYTVFQRCLIGAGQQVYFHASSAGLLEAELDQRRAEPAVAALLAQIEAMNGALTPTRVRLRPWIASFAWRAGVLHRQPSNLYFHFDPLDAPARV